MIGYIITILALIVAGAAFYYFNFKNKKNDVYLWVGSGPDPFKNEEEQR